MGRLASRVPFENNQDVAERGFGWIARQSCLVCQWHCDVCGDVTCILLGAPLPRRVAYPAPLQASRQAPAGGQPSKAAPSIPPPASTQSGL
jgi:hypothetical protein